MSRTILSSVLVSALVSLSGCGAADADTVATSVTDSTPEGRSITVESFVLAADGSPLEGVDVCTVPGHSVSSSGIRCVTSGSDGAWQMPGLPSKGQVALTFEKEGFQATLRALETGTTDLALPADENRMLPISGDASASTLGDPQLGRIDFKVTTSDGAPLGPDAITLLGADGSTKVPFYATSDNAFRAPMTPGAQGAFVNLPTGEYLLVAQSVAGCTANGLYGYPVFENPDQLPKAAALSVRVIEGYVTAPVNIACNGDAHPVAQ